jgi:serine/threonine protein kinase/tetratricopeptide (TPR) repeat protein
MGEVYRARDHDLLRIVAIKFLTDDVVSSDDRVSRFTQEARAASSLNHPNIITVHEIVRSEEGPFIVTEFVEGKTLRGLLRTEPRIPPRQALDIAAQIARGLAKAHAAGIVHRDLKPENVMVTSDGLVKVLDFGLAKLRGQETEGQPDPALSDNPTWPSEQLSPPTSPGAIVGTAGYMSPEQASGWPVDHRSDHFALGAVLYEMATGRKAFRRETRPETLTAIIREEAEPIGRFNPAFPAPACWIVERCLQKKPSHRYFSTRDLVLALEDVLSHLADASPGGSPPVPSQPPKSQGREWEASRAAHAPREGGSTPTPTPSAPHAVRRSVAVLGFKNLSEDPGAAWLSTAFSQMLTTEVAAGGVLRTIPGENVGRMKLELALSDAESLASDTLERVGRNLGADMVVLGSYLRLPSGQVRLDLRVQDVAAGETVAALAESGTEAGLVELVTRTGSELRRSIGLKELSPSEAAGLTVGIPATLAGRRLYAQGVTRLRELDTLGAKDALEQAAAEDPDSPLIHAALGECWTSLGYDGSAREETRRAFELAQGLPREQSLAVEARYWETTGDWGRAVEIHRALLAFFPDNLEYGLRLAEAQAFAGWGRRALRTLAGMRKLPAPSADDPRIDIAEALVVRSLGDSRRELAAARQARAKGAARGARLLVARAQLCEAHALERLGELAEATRAVQEARTVYEDAGDRSGVATALNRMGTLLSERGELRAARRTLEEALAIRLEIGHRFGAAVTRGNLAIVLWRQDDLDGALRAHQEAGFRELGNRTLLASSLSDLCVVRLEQGDLVTARESCEKALELLREMEDEHTAPILRSLLAQVMAAQGNLSGARTTYEEAWPVLEDNGHRTYAAMALFGLAQVLAAQDDLEGARARHRQALAFREGLGDKIGMAESSVALASLSLEEGAPGEAAALASTAATVFGEEGVSEKQGAAVALLGLALLAQGRAAEAERAVADATALVAGGQNAHLRHAAALALARIRAANGKDREAAESAEAVLDEAQKMGLVGTQFEARLVLGEIELTTDRVDDGHDRLAALEHDAGARGFGLVARKAASSAGARAQ